MERITISKQQRKKSLLVQNPLINYSSNPTSKPICSSLPASKLHTLKGKFSLSTKYQPNKQNISLNANVVNKANYRQVKQMPEMRKYESQGNSNQNSNVVSCSGMFNRMRVKSVKQDEESCEGGGIEDLSQFIEEGNNKDMTYQMDDDGYLIQEQQQDDNISRIYQVAKDMPLIYDQKDNRGNNNTCRDIRLKSSNRGNGSNVGNGSNGSNGRNAISVNSRDTKNRTLRPVKPPTRDNQTTRGSKPIEPVQHNPAIKSPNPNTQPHTHHLSSTNQFLPPTTTPPSPPLDQYQQTIKHLTFSMIKLMSVLMRWETRRQNRRNDAQPVSLVDREMIREMSTEIAQLYSRELGKYVDRLGIRQQIEEMVVREQQADRWEQQADRLQEEGGRQDLFKQSMRYPNCQQQQQQHQQQQQQQQSISTYSLKQQQQQQHHSPSSHLHHHHHNQTQHLSQEHSSHTSLNQSSNFVNFNLEFLKDFDYRQQQELMALGSGRNLLETFNHEQLRGELQQEGRGEVGVGAKCQDRAMCQDGTMRQNGAMYQDVDGSLQGMRQFQISNLKKYQQNMTKAIIHYYNNSKSLQQQHQQQQPQPSQPSLCRKLFTQPQQQQPITQLQPQTSYIITQNITLTQSANYLQLKVGDVIQLRRRVDQNRWIAQCDDKMGFVDTGSIVGRVMKVGK